MELFDAAGIWNRFENWNQEPSVLLREYCPVAIEDTNGFAILPTPANVEEGLTSSLSDLS